MYTDWHLHSALTCMPQTSIGMPQTIASIMPSVAIQKLHKALQVGMGNIHWLLGTFRTHIHATDIHSMQLMALHATSPRSLLRATKAIYCQINRYSHCVSWPVAMALYQGAFSMIQHSAACISCTSFGWQQQYDAAHYAQP